MCWHDPVLLSLKYTGRRQIQWKEANTVEGGKYSERRQIHWKEANTVEGGKYSGRRQIQWKEGVVLARPWTRARWSVTQGTGGQPTPNAVCTQHNGRPIAPNNVQTVHITTEPGTHQRIQHNELHCKYVLTSVYGTLLIQCQHNAQCLFSQCLVTTLWWHKHIL